MTDGVASAIFVACGLLASTRRPRLNGTTYSRLIGDLKTSNIEINRKMLAQLAVLAPESFTKIVELANSK